MRLYRRLWQTRVYVSLQYWQEEFTINAKEPLNLHAHHSTLQFNMSAKPCQQTTLPLLRLHGNTLAPKGPPKYHIRKNGRNNNKSR